MLSHLHNCESLIGILVPWDNGRLRVPEKLSAWPKNRKERISVSNFGIGGSNAHVRKSGLNTSYRRIADEISGNP